MTFPFSSLGGRLAARSGILDLMDELGKALTTDPEMRMLGGGNPAHIPAANALWREQMAAVMADGDRMERMLGNYDPPRGHPPFLKALASFLQSSCGWQVTPDNLAVTSGGQTALFYLFNLLGGTMPDGSFRHILLPLIPEYIGYANQGLAPNLFIGCPALIGETAPHEFKYRVDFPAVEAALRKGNIGAICVSRPTNPTGNVLTDGEIQQLSALAKAHGIPLIIDNAYGFPFPGAIFTDATPFLDSHVILTLSLSKLGLPGTRTGIVVAPPEIAGAIAAMTSVTGLANSNIGQQLVLPLLSSGRLLTLCRETIQPFYAQRARDAEAWMHHAFRDVPDWSMHRIEGAFFVWLRLTGLTIPSRQLYHELKQRKVLVVPGDPFFFGIETDWPHPHECLRINCTGRENTVREALGIIASTVRELSH
jgi:valine--pyruvate aminotransferase